MKEHKTKKKLLKQLKLNRLLSTQE